MYSNFIISVIPIGYLGSNFSTSLPTLVIFLKIIFVLVDVFFKFYFLSWLVMLKIFLYTCWPFVYLLWINVYLSPLVIFNWVITIIYCRWVVGVSYLFWILALFEIYDWKICSPLLYITFCSVGWFLWCSEVLCLMEFVYLVLLLSSVLSVNLLLLSYQFRMKIQENKRKLNKKCTHLYNFYILCKHINVAWIYTVVG